MSVLGLGAEPHLPESSEVKTARFQRDDRISIIPAARESQVIFEQ